MIPLTVLIITCNEEENIGRPPLAAASYWLTVNGYPRVFHDFSLLSVVLWSRRLVLS
jgi:hypothetical protein